MADHAITAHVFRALGTQMADVMKERRQHHFIVTAFSHGQFCGLGHVLELRHRFADVIAGAEAFIQAEHPDDHLFVIHASSSNCAMLRSASAGPTLMPTPVCISATLRPGAGRRNENGPGPREP